MKLVTLFLVLLTTSSYAQKCVQVYYDDARHSQSAVPMGVTHALMLNNLLGHFPRVEARIYPISSYRGGHIERCHSTIYLGTYYEAPIPEEFFDDFVSTRRNVAWAGYNIWLLGNTVLNELWGVHHLALSDLSHTEFDEKGDPTFHRFIDYKGSRFEKFSDFSRIKGTYNPQVSRFRTQNEKNVRAWAIHSGKQEKTPYVLERNKKWFVGDSPFSFLHEKDRYLIFADLLFDILDEAPHHSGKKPALVRVEDVHPNVPVMQLQSISKAFSELGIPYSVSIIPIYHDPLLYRVEQVSDSVVPLHKRPLWVEYFQSLNQKPVTLIFHGVTHQYGRQKNPVNGMTGDDFEFWDRVANKPVKEDNPEWVLNRLETGLAMLESAGLNPSAWLTPHYQASPLDYVLFSQLFTWNVGRIIYFPHRAKQRKTLPERFSMDQAGMAFAGARAAHLLDLKVDYNTELEPTGQFFPYPIFGDSFGQRVIPENVGNIQPYMNEQVLGTQDIDDLIDIMRRNRVLRDNWASFFFHPFRVMRTEEEGTGKFDNDLSEIIRLIKTAKELGYEFVDLKQWISKNGSLKRVPPTFQYGAR